MPFNIHALINRIFLSEADLLLCHQFDFCLRKLWKITLRFLHFNVCVILFIVQDRLHLRHAATSCPRSRRAKKTGR